MREKMSIKAMSQIVTVVLAICVTIAAAGIANAKSSVFTVAKYPVEATGKNAVAAKRTAIAEGRKSAFRSLLKRLVPASSYGLIEQLKQIDPTSLVDGVSVRSEENSATQYLATLDYVYNANRVRALLAQHSVPFVAQPAGVTNVLLTYHPSAGGGTAEMSAKRGAKSWRNVWSGLDLANSVAPIQLTKDTARLSPETMQALLRADPDAVAELGSRYRTAQIIVADARVETASKTLLITLAGQDAVGRFALTTRYRLDASDFDYSLELAAVIAQGVLEGRWKRQQTGGRSGGAVASGGGGAVAAMQLVAEFTSLGHWQRQQQALAETPGVRNLQIGGLSGRSATIALSYPGGGPALQAALGSRGLTLENINGFWILR